MRPLAVASTERLPELPDVPTFQEAGMDIVEGLSIGLFAPAGTPADRVEILRKGFMEMSKDPEFREVYGRLGQDINGFMAGDEYQADWDQSWAEARDLLGAVIAR